MTRAEAVCEFVERYCLVPDGAGVGHPLVLAEFQREFIHAIYDNPAGTRRAYLSIARKNGKSALIAALLLAHLVGPEAKQNAQLVSGAMSRDQAALVFNLAAKMIELSPRLSKLVRIVPSGKRLIGLPLNTEFKALAADGRTAHGLSPVLAILDEVGQVRGPQSDFVDAITTSQGAHESPLLIAISTQAPTDGDLFSRWLDDAAKSDDPRIVCRLYAAPESCDLMDEAGWIAANPALGLFRGMDDLRDQMAQAQRMPSMENSVRNLLLNQRVEQSAMFVSSSVWQSNGSEPRDLRGREVYGGLDLSSVSDLTALVLVGEQEGEWDVESTFWLPEQGLTEKARQDRVPYDVWHKQGLLQATPGASISYDFVAMYLRGVFNRYNVRKLAFDRYNMKFLRPCLLRAGFTEAEIDEKFVEFGQGMVSMSPALRELETMLLRSELRHGNHPVLSMCAANAALEIDAAENRKFTKKKSTGRIDGLVALAMAVGTARVGKDAAPVSPYETRGIRTL